MSSSAPVLEAIIEQLAEAIAARVAERIAVHAPPSTATPQPQFLDEGAVEARFRLKRRTLQSWRLRGGGPPWVRVGRRVLYPVDGVEEFLGQRPHARSTRAARCAEKSSGTD